MAPAPASRCRAVIISDGEMESSDPLLDAQIAEAWRRLPGPSYLEVLQLIHETRRPTNYLEIGVRHGMSMGTALPETPCIGVDPRPALEREFPNTKVYALTSDEFFARYDASELLGGPIEAAFIDGLHLFEQVLTDFMHVERHSGAETVVMLHDCLPLDEETSSREQKGEFYSGDVWKATLALRRVRPDLEMVIVPTSTHRTLHRAGDSIGATRCSPRIFRGSSTSTGTWTLCTTRRTSASYPLGFPTMRTRSGPGSKAQRCASQRRSREPKPCSSNEGTLDAPARRAGRRPIR